MAQLLKRVAIIGHSLIARENQLAFQNWKTIHIDLIMPKKWTSRSLGHDYHSQYNTLPAHGLTNEIPTTHSPTFHTLTTVANGRNSFFIWVGLKKLLLQLKPDAIYCWEEPWTLATWQIGNIGQSLGIPLIFYTAENRNKHLPWPFSLLQNHAFRLYKASIAPTHEIGERIRSTGYKGHIVKIPLWIRPRKNLRPAPQNLCLGYVGRLIPLKRVHLLVESLELLPGFKLKIIGDGPEKASLMTLATRLGVSNRISFLGHVDNSNLDSVLEGVSLLLLPTGETPSQAEQFGKAALEGVAFGLPVLVSRTGNLAVLAQSIPTLVAKDLDSASQVAEEIQSIWKKFPTAQALSNSRDFVENNYGPQVVALELESLFSALFSGAY